MKIIAFTNNFFGTGETKQKALINLLNELEKNNAQAQRIKFNDFKDEYDPFEIIDRGFYNKGSIEL